MEPLLEARGFGDLGETLQLVDAPGGDATRRCESAKDEDHPPERWIDRPRIPEVIKQWRDTFGV